MNKNLLNKKISETPIILPDKPFWEVFKRFGRDEIIALIISTLSTFLITIFLSLFPKINPFTKILIISASGPIFEKFGFFPAHFYIAIKEYKSLLIKKGFFKYFLKAIKNGSKSLIEDILLHDPIYIVLMFIGISLYSETPPWILSTTSFMIAVLSVSFLEVSYHEINFLIFKKKLLKIGFEEETYYETRFLIKKEKNKEEILNSFTKEFNLPDFFERIYCDKYYSNKIKTYSARVPQFRLRTRTTNDGYITTIQIVFIRATEISKKNPSQFRFFPSKKNKIYYILENKPESILYINNKKLKNFIKKNVSIEKDCSEINFKRLVSYDRKTLFICLDEIDDMPFYIIELKTYKNLELLKKAMRYIMIEFPVIQTTHKKYDLLHFD